MISWSRVPDFLCKIRIPDPDPGFWWWRKRKIYRWKFFKHFLLQISLYLFIDLIKGPPSWIQEKPPALRREDQALQNMKVTPFFVGHGHICLPGPGFGSRFTIRVQSGSGFETPIKRLNPSILTGLLRWLSPLRRGLERDSGWARRFSPCFSSITCAPFHIRS